MSVTKTFRFPDEVVAQKVDVIVTNGTPGLCGSAGSGARLTASDPAPWSSVARRESVPSRRYCGHHEREGIERNNRFYGYIGKRTTA